ncbi:MAG: cation-translocating P-type ATPase [Candidatus Omnitrophica bacterium]|nr:cation-translocating P-type ATPase [Candidatus Omnitrophota bacterium]
MLTAAMKAGMEKQALEAANKLVIEIPFDTERKRMSILRETAQGRVLFVKGAPAVILDHSNTILMRGQTLELSSDLKNTIEEVNQKLASQALRVLAVAYRNVGLNAKADSSLGEDLTFVGLIAMMDLPRPEVKIAVETCKKAGIRSVMITADHKETALAIARELGLGDNVQAMHGLDLDHISDEDLKNRVDQIGVYARVSAEHKLKIVRALKSHGEVVAMTGDGVNDAPAVKEADIGVAMGITGTDVTKEASDMVITDDNFASIVNAVEEGRGIYDNIVKFVKYLLSFNIAEVLVIFIAMLFGLKDSSGASFIPMTAVQLLWLNLVTDGLPAIALGVDPISRWALERPPRRSSESIFTPAFTVHMIVISILVTIGTLAACFYGLRHSNGLAQTMTLTTMVMLELVGAQMVRLTSGVGFFSNPLLLWALLISLFLQLLIIYVPGFEVVFDLIPLSLMDWAVIIGVTLGVGFLGWIVNPFINRIFDQK